MKKFINQLYIFIKYRTTSPRYTKYFGLDRCSKEEFLKFSDCQQFEDLYNNWLASGKKRALVPTADRIDPTKGYTIGNMQWKTLGDNSRRARFEMRNKPSGLPTGVRFYGTHYLARIRDHYKQIDLGLFKTAEEAHEAYLTAKKKQNR